MAPEPYYLDCDTGVDDAMALAYLLASPEVTLAGVGTVSGNVDAGQAARNTLGLLQLAGRAEIPVAVGEHHPLAGPYAGPVPHIHGGNGVGDVTLPPGPAPARESAPEMIARLAHAHPGRLRLLTTGPLTNIAAALTLEPAVAGLVRDITIMGGAAHAAGNITAAAEANIAGDPEAAAAVLAAAWDITLVPLDVTMAHALREHHRERLLHAGGPVARAIGEMLDCYFDFHIGIYGYRSCAAHDPLAAAVAVGGVTPALAPVVHVTVDDTSGPGRGQTICDLRGEYLGYPSQPGARCRVVLTADTDVAEHLTQRLLRI